MIVALLLVALAVAVVSVVEGNPVEWAKQRYYDVVDETVAVQGVTATVYPGGADVDEAIDRDPTSYWGTPWRAGAPDLSRCADAAVSLRLSWRDTVRVRGLRVAPGLRPDSTARLAHPQPTSLLVSWTSDGGARQCERLLLEDGPQSRKLSLDTEDEVDTLWVAVGSVDEPPNVTVERPAAIREIAVLRRP